MTTLLDTRYHAIVTTDPAGCASVSLAVADFFTLPFDRIGARYWRYFFGDAG